MEHNPFSTNNSGSESGFKPPETANKDKDKDKKDSKKSKAIGSLAFEHEASSGSTESSNEKPKQSLFDMLSPSEDKSASPSARPDENIDVKSAVEELSSEVINDAETGETGGRERNRPEMTDADRQEAAEQIAEARLADMAAESTPEVGDQESLAEAAAAQDFYERIIHDKAAPEDAAAEVLDRMHNDEDIEDTPGEPEDFTAPVVPLPSPTQPVRRTVSQPRKQPPHTVVPPISSPGSQQPMLPTSHTEYVPYIDRSHAFSDMMIGGIVGYFVGRRRGRIKTERKLIPIQEKLEREVTSLTRTVASQEMTIRQAARKRVREHAAIKQPSEVIIPLRSPRGSEAPKRETRERAATTTLRVSPERLEVQMPIAPPEHIGKVVIAAEAATSRDVISESEMAKTVDLRTAQKRVETLSRNDLLTLSEKIRVEGSTLRQVYETHLLSERGLRRLVAEYLRGGDVVRAFKRELIDRQMDFERDPKLRDTIRKNVQATGGKSPTLQKLLAQAGVTTDDDLRAADTKSKNSDKRAAQLAKKHHNQQKAIDVSLITVIAVLLAVIIVLVVRKTSV